MRYQATQEMSHPLTAYLAEKYNRPPKLIKKIITLAYAEATRINVSPLLILAMIEQESGFDPLQSNSYGATGLMQVVGRVHKDKLPLNASLSDLLEPATNIHVGANILKEYLKKKKGDLNKALAQYSGNSIGYANKVAISKRALEHRCRGFSEDSAQLLVADVY
ncbi:MAG: lytic transglycosylase domain-containing protein [Agitococcus sp.]|nr:lytic transglycosylase domain-containing protein [Agitococcus sp.]MDO9177014.1 lytic transglycosylase domain-containing protein [Agitococcus sp.]